jgi:hypothetical protein
VLNTLHGDHRIFMQRRAPESEAAASNRLTVMLDWMEPGSK